VFVFAGASFGFPFLDSPSLSCACSTFLETLQTKQKGEAVTFFTEDDAGGLRTIANVVRASGGDVPEWMLALPKSGKKRGRGRDKSGGGGGSGKGSGSGGGGGANKRKRPALAGVTTQPEKLQKSAAAAAAANGAVEDGSGGGSGKQRRQAQNGGGGGGAADKRKAKKSKKASI
jgi:ATP-dependent RNA helicase DDX52/ROK1